MTILSSKAFRCAAITAATTLFLLPPMPPGAQAQEVRWDMPNEYGEATITGQADKVFSKLLEDNSDGRIKITHHFGGSLGFRSVDHWSSVEDGAVALASTYVGVFTGIDPIFILTSMPFLATNPVESKALIDAARAEYEKVFAGSNQVLLYTEPWVPVGIWATKPVITPEDLKGLRIRTYDRNGTEVMEKVGAAPVQMTWSDVVPALATKTIESVLTGASPGLATNFQDYMTHYHEVGFVMGSSMIHMNRDVFDDLSPDLQEILLDTAAEAEEIVWKNVSESLKDDFAHLKEVGVTIHPEPTPELIGTLKAAAEPILDDWKTKMPDGVADGILSRYRELLAERQ